MNPHLTTPTMSDSMDSVVDFPLDNLAPPPIITDTLYGVKCNHCVMIEIKAINDAEEISKSVISHYVLTIPCSIVSLLFSPFFSLHIMTKSNYRTL